MREGDGRPPLATADQEAVELVAARLLTDPDVAATLERIGQDWIAEMKPNAEHRARFSSEYEQAALLGLMNAANDDPLYPRLHGFARYPHQTQGISIPGTKSAHPNPDYIYRFVPIDGQSRYVIHGRFPEHGPVATEYAMLTAEQVYQKNVSLADLVIDADGRFTITIDGDPANGRPNHFQTNADSFQILLRDVISDPGVQLPIALEVERLGPEPSRPPKTYEEIRGEVERHVRKHVDDLVFVTRNFVLSNPVNTFASPEVKAESMYSVGQAYSPGHYRITDDEAMVITLGLGGAAYAVVPVSDQWGGLGDILNHQVHLGTGCAAPNPDGSFTFVLAMSDPGVANWIDANGLHEGVMFIRWIGLPARSESQSVPTLKTDIVDLADLESALPEGVPRLSRAQRAEQLARRRSDYLRVMG